MPSPVARLLSSVCLLWGALAAQAAPAPAPAVAPAAAPAVPPLAAVTGRLDRHDGLAVLHLWGSPRDRGYAHGRLLAAAIARTAIAEFTARFARQPGLLQQARAALPRLIELPVELAAAEDGLWQGLLDSGVDLRMPELERSFDRQDLAVVTALDVFGLMGCSGFTVWGDRAQGGGVLTARNFDWPLSGPHLLDETLLRVEHLPGGRAVAAVAWPGYLGTVTGVSSDGLALFLHVGTGRVSFTPEPGSWPTAAAAQTILAAAPLAEAAAVFQRAESWLANTSPPAGYLTRLVLPTVPAEGPPFQVFETDVKQCVRALVDAPRWEVVTNHFTQRTDGRKPSKDSRDRQHKLEDCLGGCLQQGDQRVSVEEAWQALAAVERGGGHAFGTLHALVFRHEPWHFELRLGELRLGKVVAAPSSARRHLLSRAQLFAAPGPAAPAAK